MDLILAWKWIKGRGFREWMLLILTIYLAFGGWKVLNIAMAEETEFTVESPCGDSELLATDLVAQMSTTADLLSYSEAIKSQQRAYECLDQRFGEDVQKSLAYYFWNESLWLAKSAQDNEINWVTEYGFSPQDCLAEFQRAFCILRNYGQEAVRGMATAKNPVDLERWRDQLNAVNAAFDGNITSAKLPVPAQPAQHVLSARFVRATAGYSSREMFTDANPMSLEIKEE